MSASHSRLRRFTVSANLFNLLSWLTDNGHAASAGATIRAVLRRVRKEDTLTPDVAAYDWAVRPANDGYELRCEIMDEDYRTVTRLSRQIGLTPAQGIAVALGWTVPAIVCELGAGRNRK